MTLTEYLTISATVFSAVAAILACIVLTRLHASRAEFGRLDDIRRDISAEFRSSRTESIQQTQAMSSSLNQNIGSSFAREDARLASMQDLIDDRLRAMDKRISDSSLHSEVKLESMRDSMEKRLQAIRDDSSRQLDEIRNTVDEKLQKTLEDKIGQSFRLVSERLEQVYRSLGEMQSLAEGVGDLRKVLSNVKTRGIFGELQLGSILSEILSQEQYDTNVVTKPGSNDPVEFAVKFPGDGGGTVYLPIDSKFPMDAYQALLDAYDSADKAAVDAAGSFLETRIRQEGKKIRDKYISPPNTTDFAVMFFPVEGLYAEAVRRGLVDALQQNYRVSIAGPTTMAALLNSLQMGFRTLAIQKRSGEVWKVLGEVRNEFDTFGAILESAQGRIMKVNEDLDKLIGVRTRQIQRRLKDVSKLPASGAPAISDDSDDIGITL